MPETSTRLLPSSNAHFDWLLSPRRVRCPTPGLVIPRGGVDSRDMLEDLQASANLMRAGSSLTTSWLILEPQPPTQGRRSLMVVGLSSLRALPDARGRVEIGYGVAEACRGRGHATRAVAQMLVQLKREPMVTRILATTAEDNPASHRVLEKNGFVTTGRGHSVEDGPVLIWAHGLGRAQGD